MVNAVRLAISSIGSAVPVRLRCCFLLGYLDSLASSLGKSNNQEYRFQEQENQSEDGWRGVDVQLEA